METRNVQAMLGKEGEVSPELKKMLNEIEAIADSGMIWSASWDGPGIPVVPQDEHDLIVSSLTRMLEVAVRQRNYWSQYAGEYLQNKHLDSDDAEIIAAGRGEG